ncbi:malto-oligosyltrehalose synthase [Rhizobium paknamense]|uniref:(1->4)-alpha-D-glucan 1-alpha-D-glucosylmutase n=1 Tax=Rhizobium paknamense TaxID=1206817 RepID=A0ABU0IBG5_9HYPH|nr:malto-oligosyltrehalose synthase [Rhizobium paknamense]MDQ0455562.1 (1->4)-alpha-D-glucan 1-alpha-D-glucosylmutase [Rhizobium paknamense]
MAPSTLPRATYRLQFRNGMTFHEAERLIPHLQALGISHLYASPVFTATDGSGHGYDVTDFNEIDPSLGGIAGFRRLAEALRAAGLGLVLDIVPNHMASSLSNNWWFSIIEWGTQSPFADYFDVDWSEPLTLPFLGTSFDSLAASGEVTVVFDRSRRRLGFQVYELFYPLTPASWAFVLEGCDLSLARDLRDCAAAGSPDLWEEAREALSVSSEDQKALDTVLAAKGKQPGFLTALHEMQPYRLVDWRQAKDHLTYRRFFEVAELVGLRVEDEKVFAHSHRLVLDLVRDGLVQGLRVDHIDGLADPTGYLHRLREAVGPDVYLLVEKILEKDERLPPNWPVEGTTGYEFISSMADALVPEDGLARLQAAYQGMSGDSRPYRTQLEAAKSQMLTVNFAGEVRFLAAIAANCNAEDCASPSPEDLEAAIRALVLELPVYRTYADEKGLTVEDQALLAQTAERARQASPPALIPAIDYLCGLMQGPLPVKNAAMLRRFRARFQQLGGPIMAKSLEDTLFYRLNVLLGLNEVGGDPSHVGGLEVFHATMKERRRFAPFALLATSTHDTKRGEDARARLYALAEAPEMWIAGVERWREINKGRLQHLPDGVAPEPEMEWMLYQALLGVWPLKGPDAPDFPGELPKRFSQYLTKALREAKLRTNWGAENQAYEQAVQAYAACFFDRGNQAFIADFHSTSLPFIRAGLLNSLSQTLVKLTAPGVPDIYQGSEHSDFSLVDPDNRRVVDFRLPPSGAPKRDIAGFEDYKAWLIATCLHLRAEAPQSLFTEGDYEPVSVEGPAAQHLIAFMRESGGAIAITLAPRSVLKLLTGEELLLDQTILAESRLRLPSRIASCAFRDILSGERVSGQDIALGKLLQAHPLSLLVSGV